MAKYKTTIRTTLEKFGVIEKASEILGGVATLVGNASDPFAMFRGGSKVSTSKAMASFSGWTYAAVRAVAEDIMNANFKLMQINADDSSEELQEHELLNLLDAPNKVTPGPVLWYKVAAHLDLCGNAYILMSGVKNETDKPQALILLDPAKIKALKDKDPEKIMDGYEYQDGGFKKRYEDYEIIHIIYPDPSDSVDGLGTVQAIAAWIDEDNYATGFNRAFFKNGARIGGFLESENVTTPEQLDYLRKSFDQIYSGGENAHRTAALPTGTKFKEPSSNQKDMDFQEGQKFGRDKILAGFRVPKPAIGLTEDVNRANAEATDYIFATRTIKPKLKLIALFLQLQLVYRYGDNLWLKMENVIPEDMEAKTKELTAAVGSQPVMSINEARERFFGLGPIDGGDMVMGNALMTGIGAPTKGQGPAKTKIRIPKNVRRKAVEDRGDLSKEIVKAALGTIKEFDLNTKAAKKRAIKDITALSQENYGAVHKAFITRVSEYEKAMDKKMKEFNEETRAEVKKNIKKQAEKGIFSSQKDINPDALFDQENAISSLVDLATPILTDLYAKEGAAAAELIGVNGLDLLTPEVKKAIDHSISLLSKRYNETSREVLKDALTKIMAEGPDLDKLEKMLLDRADEIFDYGAEVRAPMVAQTETFRIGNKATTDAWKKSGVVETVKWYTASGDPCVFCQAMAKKDGVKPGDNWFKKGDTVEGTDGTEMELGYDDIAHPPLHAKCYCYVRPDKISVED